MAEDVEIMAREMAELLQKIMLCCHFKDEQHASNFNVSSSECRTMRVFARNEELTMKSLSERMNLAMSRMTRIVDGLVEKNLVQRGVDPRDRRVCLVKLTERGQKMVDDMDYNYQVMNERVLGNVSRAARPEVLNALKHLVDAMEQFRASCAK